MKQTPHDPMQPYRNRSYMLHKLDQRVFDALNKTPVWRDTDGTLREAGPAAIEFLNGYCLDAIDSIPGGSMRGPAAGPIQTYVQRNDLDTSPEERRRREEIAKRIIQEILEESECQTSSTKT